MSSQCIAATGVTRNSPSLKMRARNPPRPFRNSCAPGTKASSIQVAGPAFFGAFELHALHLKFYPDQGVEIGFARDHIPARSRWCDVPQIERTTKLPENFVGKKCDLPLCIRFCGRNSGRRRFRARPHIQFAALRSSDGYPPRGHDVRQNCDLTKCRDAKFPRQIISRGHARRCSDGALSRENASISGKRRQSGVATAAL